MASEPRKCIPCRHQIVDSMAWLSSFLFWSDHFVFDFPHSGRDICGYMICGAQGFSILCPFYFCDEHLCAGLGHHRPTPSVQSVASLLYLTGAIIISSMVMKNSRSNSSLLRSFHSKRSGCGGLHNSWRQGALRILYHTARCEIM